MTLNTVIDLILRFFTEFDRFQADYISVVEDRPIMSVKYEPKMIVSQFQSFTFDENYNATCSTVSLR